MDRIQLEVKELTKIYGPQRAIDQVSFSVGGGQVVGFLGKNGAGKTTTMKIITGFMEPSSGTVNLGELDIFKNSREIRARIGYLPEHNPLYLDMYVHEFLEYVGRLHRLQKTPGDWNANKIKHRVTEVIEMTGLGREQHKQIGMLSKGYRQRVGLAQALLHNPEILILDEPTTGLDPVQIEEIRSLIKNFGKEKTVIFSTHILPEVEAIADRVLIIDRGLLKADKKMQELRNESEEGFSLSLEFENPGFDFSFLKNDAHVSIQDQGNNRYLLLHSEGEDLRRAVFQHSIEQNNPIFGMQVNQMSLEDIFKRITEGAA